MGSIANPSKSHPFPAPLLDEVRRIIGAPDVSCAPGQPFYLSVMSHLAALAGDNDADFPKVLEEGVPLGMDSLTLRSPGIWPSKEELRGEDLEPSHL